MRLFCTKCATSPGKPPEDRQQCGKCTQKLSHMLVSIYVPERHTAEPYHQTSHLDGTAKKRILRRILA